MNTRTAARHTAPAMAAIVLVSLNLRPAASSTGPVLTQLSADLGLSPTVAGLLTSLPVLCFGVFGSLSPWLSNRFGLHRTMATSIVVLVAGLFGRVLVGDQTGFLVCSCLALAGGAIANVLLPSVVKRHFDGRIGTVTAIYTTVLITGLSIGGMLTAPIAEATGSWRIGLGTWAVVAATAILPWVPMTRFDAGHRPSAGHHRIGFADIARTRLGWHLALFFAFQSGSAYAVFGWLATMYQHAGYSATGAGLYLGIATGVGIPLGFLLPTWTARRSPFVPILVIGVGGVLGYGGMLLAPRAAPVLWAVLIAIGTAGFPIFLTLMGLRARTPEGTVALSAFAQSVGYLLAIPGPLLVGVLLERTGSFDWPLIMLTLALIPLTTLGILAARSDHIEDQLPHRPPTP